MKAKFSAINWVFLFFIVTAVLVAAFSGRMREVGDASFDAAKGAVTLALSLVGIMGLWLGLVRVLEAGGFMQIIARAVYPVMRRLFPEVPGEHPAMSAIVLNISANMLGLGNAATPFGIKAMIELNKLNPLPGVATNAMCMLLAINTSNVSLLPLGTIGVRAAAGSSQPAAIFLPTVLATTFSTVTAVFTAWLLAARDAGYRRSVAEKRSQPEQIARSNEPPAATGDEPRIETFDHLRVPARPWMAVLARVTLALFCAAFVYRLLAAPSAAAFLGTDFVSYWLVPGLILGIVLFGLSRGVKVYESVVEGAKQGFEVALRIIPFLVAILVAVAMFRASGAMDFLTWLLAPVTELVWLPAETLPLALVRPLSGSGAFAIMSSIVSQAPDSYSAFVASVMMGSTETTFYILAVYFGAAGVFRMRHALAAGLVADVAGIVGTGVICHIFWAG